MSRSLVETLLGAAVIVVAALFIVFAYTRSSVATVDGYLVSAKFTRVDGLLRGADVRVGGIKVGSVIEQTLDTNSFQAVVQMSIADHVKLPVDSSAAVVSDGLLGGKYIDIEPGGEDDVLKADSVITHTQSSFMIEQVVGKFIFGGE